MLLNDHHRLPNIAGVSNFEQVCSHNRRSRPRATPRRLRLIVHISAVRKSLLRSSRSAHAFQTSFNDESFLSTRYFFPQKRSWFLIMTISIITTCYDHAKTRRSCFSNLARGENNPRARAADFYKSLIERPSWERFFTDCTYMELMARRRKKNGFCVNCGCRVRCRR